jgi:hypothetical protein
MSACRRSTWRTGATCGAGRSRSLATRSEYRPGPAIAAESVVYHDEDLGLDSVMVRKVDSTATRPGVVHSGSDPHVPRADVEHFVEEMTVVETEWQLNVCRSALHG